MTAGALYRYTRLGIWKATFIGICLALNPVQTTQYFTKYVDGQLSATFTIMLISLFIGLIADDRLNLFCLGTSLIYLINTKYSGLLYSATECVNRFGTTLFGIY